MAAECAREFADRREYVSVIARAPPHGRAVPF